MVASALSSAQFGRFDKSAGVCLNSTAELWTDHSSEGPQSFKVDKREVIAQLGEASALQFTSSDT